MNKIHHSALLSVTLCLPLPPPPVIVTTPCADFTLSWMSRYSAVHLMFPPTPSSLLSPTAPSPDPLILSTFFSPSPYLIFSPHLQPWGDLGPSYHPVFHAQWQHLVFRLRQINSRTTKCFFGLNSGGSSRNQDLILVNTSAEHLCSSMLYRTCAETNEWTLKCGLLLIVLAADTGLLPWRAHIK